MPHRQVTTKRQQLECHRDTRMEGSNQTMIHQQKRSFRCLWSIPINSTWCRTRISTIVATLGQVLSCLIMVKTSVRSFLKRQSSMRKKNLIWRMVSKRVRFMAIRCSNTNNLWIISCLSTITSLLLCTSTNRRLFLITTSRKLFSSAWKVSVL